MQRRYDLDWLRVIAFGLLILFHTGMMFSTWNWSVKNLETSDGLDMIMGFLHEWRMPLLFFISGSAVWFAMDRYSTWQFFLERHKRLLLPLVFGMLVVVPPQIYCERLYFNRQYDSFWDFYRTVFTTGPYPEGNNSWHHLWYIPYIWTYSLLMLPIFVWARTKGGRAALDYVHRWLGKTWPLFLIFVPTALSDILVRPYWPRDHMNLISDWGNFSHKLTFFVIGFILASGTSIYDTLAVQRRKFLITAGVATLLVQAFWRTQWHPAWAGERAYHILDNLSIWMWIMAALAYGRYYLNFNHPFLRYATDAVYPFYILHQTITIILAYWLVYVNWSLPLKFLVVASGTFGGCWVLYEFAIKRWNWLRVCFGMKWKTQVPSQASDDTQKRPANAAFGTLARAVGVLLLLTTAGCSSHQSRLVIESIKAPSLAGNRFGVPDEQHLVVYLPPSYGQSTNRYPVIYFLPNFDNPLWRYTGGTYQGFHLREAMDRQIASGAASEAIIVIPNAAHLLGISWYLNSPLTGNWEDYITKDLVQFMDSHFRTVATAQARGISGHGVGGFGALNLALKHPEIFGSVYAMSPALFDSNGLAESGLANEQLFSLWKTNSQHWSGLNPVQQRRAMRDYFQRRINSPSRERLYEGLAFSYASVCSADTNQAFPHVLLPGSGSVSQPEVLARFERGLGGWNQKIAAFKQSNGALQQITIEYGSDDEFAWLRRGSAHVSELLRDAGITNSLVISEGKHDSTLGRRLETAMLPTMSKSLRSE